MQELAHTILVVEDDDDVRESLAMMLRLEGFMVATAVDGQDAIEQLDAGLRPCIALVDLMMPRVGGVKLCETMRQSHELAAIPVIVCSAAPDLPNRIAHLAIAAVFQKPFVDPTALLRVVRDHC